MKNEKIKQLTLNPDNTYSDQMSAVDTFYSVL